MRKKYVLLIQELNNENVDIKNPETFNMNDVINSARDGHTALLEQLHQATKISVYERQISFGKKTIGKEVIKQSCICTPRKGRNVVKEKIDLIFPTNDEIIAHLVSYHNENSEQTGMEQISLDELKELYQATQQKHTL